MNKGRKGHGELSRELIMTKTLLGSSGNQISVSHDFCAIRKYLCSLMAVKVGILHLTPSAVVFEILFHATCLTEECYNIVGRILRFQVFHNSDRGWDILRSIYFYMVCVYSLSFPLFPSLSHRHIFKKLFLHDHIQNKDTKVLGCLSNQMFPHLVNEHGD